MHLIRPPIDQLPEDMAQAVVAIGNFDGVHQGHQHVLTLAQRLARARGLPFGILSFEPHPRAYFARQTPLFRLSPEVTKLALFKAANADFTAIASFDAALAATSAESFLEGLVIGGLAASHVVVGFDFHFGARRAGTPQFLKEWGAAHGLGVTIADAKQQGGVPISSSRIRAALEEGDIALANTLLGYRWFVTGTVIHGDKRGRELGYPTANMALPPETGLAHGIYAIRALVEGRVHGGAASFGRRPQFDNGAVLLEPYLFDFSANIYGKEISVEFLARLRGEERFDSVDALIAQMERDCEAARVLIGEAQHASIIAGDALPLA